MKRLNVKNVLMALALTTSIQSGAHQVDSDYLINVGVGSEIIATKDINIKPNSSYISMGWSESDSYYKEPHCYLEYRKSNKDRVIVRNTIFTVIETKYFKSDPNSQVVYLTLSVKNHTNDFVNMKCHLWTEYNYNNQLTTAGEAGITIGETKKALSGYFNLIIAQPEKF